MKKLVTENGECVAASVQTIISKIHWVDRNDYKVAMEGKDFASDFDSFK